MTIERFTTHGVFRLASHGATFDLDAAGAEIPVMLTPPAHVTPSPWCDAMGLLEPEPLQPLAPSPWSPVAPTEPGFYWHWSGRIGERAQHVKVGLGPDWEFTIIVAENPLFRSARASDAGGFWMPRARTSTRPDTSCAPPQTTPDRTSKILAQQLAKLELITKIMRHGPFEGWASEIDGVVSTLRAANFLAIDKVERMSIKEIEEDEELIHSAIAFLILHLGSVRAKNLASDAGFAAARLAEAAKKGAK